MQSAVINQFMCTSHHLTNLALNKFFKKNFELAHIFNNYLDVYSVNLQEMVGSCTPLKHGKAETQHNNTWSLHK